MFSVYPSTAEHFRRRFRIWKSVSVLFRSQRSEAGCQQDDFPVHKADDGLLHEGWQCVLSECLCVLRPGHTSTSLPFQSCPQHFRQFFATHGGSPQNTLTSLRTQIVFFRHLFRQNLRQERSVFFAGALPSIVHQELAMRGNRILPESLRILSIFPQVEELKCCCL